MNKKISIRLRISIMVIVLLTICCCILTFMINFSAMKMVDTIEMQELSPASTQNNIVSTNSIQLTKPSSAIDFVRKDFRIESGLFMIIVVISGGLITYYLIGKTLKPIAILNDQMKKISVLNLNENIDIPNSNDEVADLSQTFNDMTNKLHNSFETQKRFSTSCAHELRTPLAIIQTKIDIFYKKSNPTINECTTLIDNVAKQNSRLTNIVLNLLDMTNMQTVNQKEEVDLNFLLDEVCYELQDIADKKNISLNINGDDITILGNFDLLHRAFYNLVENAIKYNNNDGIVNIIVQKQNNKAIIKIIDNGIGINKKDFSQIFEPFFRSDKVKNNNEGIGLGLSITKSIIDRHFGFISVYKLDNDDTCFEVTLDIETFI